MLAFNDTWRDTRALLLAAWIGMSAIPEGVAQEITPSLRAVPSALLSIDQNRGTVVERIVADWGEALTKSTAGITIDQLRSTLLSMRSDYLLAASVAGSLEGLRSVVATAKCAQCAEGSTSSSCSNVSRARSYWPEWW